MKKSITASQRPPNYMKPTSSSDARKELTQSNKVSNSQTSSCNNKNLHKRNMKHKPCSRILTRLSSFKATCSSTLKNSKFPNKLKLNPGGTMAQGASAVKVCKYNHCSLNAHHHPPLKVFLKSTRRSMKTRNSIKKMEDVIIDERSQVAESLSHGSPPESEIDDDEEEDDAIPGATKIDWDEVSIQMEKLSDLTLEFSPKSEKLVWEGENGIESDSTEDALDPVLQEIIEDEGECFDDSDLEPEHESNQNQVLPGNYDPSEESRTCPETQVSGQDDQVNDEKISSSMVTHQCCAKEVDQMKAEDQDQDAAETSNRKWKIGSKKPIHDSEEQREFNPRAPNYLPIAPDSEAEKVDLKHQMMDERRNAEEWMLDYALQRTVTKLNPRKKKVALLVEAFETIRAQHQT